MEAGVMAEWRSLWTDFCRRLASIGDPPRLFYFFVVVVWIGGLGAWQSASADFKANLASYAMGIAAAALVELVLPDGVTRSMKMLGITLGIVAIYWSLTASSTSQVALLGFGQVDSVWIAPVAAWLLWILSASSNANIGSTNPVAATGGDIEEVAGNTDGFQT